MSNIKPRCGEIWLVNLDPTVGREINKTRPCLVIQSDIINEHLQTTIVAPITSTIKEDWPFTIILEKGDGGLKNKSMVLFNQVRSVDARRLIKKLGKITDEQILKSKSALCVVFEIASF